MQMFCFSLYSTVEQVNFLSLSNVSHPELSQIATLAIGFSQKIVLIHIPKQAAQLKTTCPRRVQWQDTSSLLLHLLIQLHDLWGIQSIAYDIKPNRALNLSKQNYHTVNKPTNSYVTSLTTAALRNWTQVKSVWCACKTWLAFIAKAGSHDQNF